MPDTPLIKRLTILGPGLIGGSLARALRRAGAVEEVVGCARREATLQRGVELGVIDRGERDPGKAVSGADMVVVAVPVGASEAVFKAIAPHLDADAAITDVGSAKGSVVEAARRTLGVALPNFVPGHPVAGTEQSGVESSFDALFERRCVLLTPLAGTRQDALARVRAMWEAAGARVVEMDVAHHDQVLAATSHLPHMLAYALVDTLARMDETEEIFSYAAGGFRDFTRIASSDPVMWRDICLANREALVAMLDRFRADLDVLSEAVRNGDGERLLTIFEHAKAVRDRHGREE